MNIRFTDDGWGDYQHWVASDRDVLKRLNAVIEDARRSPFKGLGKPEPLKGTLAGLLSRRITGDHRLVYRVAGKARTDQHMDVAASRYHY